MAHAKPCLAVQKNPLDGDGGVWSIKNNSFQRFPGGRWRPFLPELPCGGRDVHAAVRMALHPGGRDARQQVEHLVGARRLEDS